MCMTCGCSHNHSHDHHHHHQSHHHSFVFRVPVPEKKATTVLLEKKILEKNNRLAIENRAYFRNRKILALNMMSSPGAGKTTLLVRTIQDLRPRFPIQVIE